MSPTEARAIADETIRYWQRMSRLRRSRLSAAQVYGQVTGKRYPGGGWERVRMAMIDWLLEQETEPEMRMAAE